MANALKTLFTDIAESIRGGLPDEGLMKPNVFPSKIDEIVALLENAGSSEGGTGSSGSVGNLKFASGSYNVGTNRNRATVTHGFDTMPDLIIVWYTGFYGGTKEEYVEEFPLELAWGMKSKFSSKTLSGYVIPGFGVSANSGINNNYTDSIGIYCPDQYTFQFGSSVNDGGGRLLTGARYNWLAISGMGGAIGGVDSDLVKYVTFIGADGTEFCEEMPVLNGDDCKNPITHWNLSEPTKESTAQYNYTYSGWSLTDGGAADANALKAVTEDRTVYAAFTATARKYTIMYYDDDGSFLSSQTLAYGATPSYTPEKGCYKFTGWIPEISSVVGDASYTATWIEQVDFASSPWSYIAELSETGMADKVFKVGDKKPFSYSYGGTTYNINAEIIAFNHDDKADGSGKVGITLCCDVSNDELVNLNESNKTYNGRTSRFAGGYGMCDMRDKLNGEIFNTLPEEMRSVIKTVSKDWFNPTDKVIKTTSETLWLFSCSEICACVRNNLKSTIRDTYTFATEGTRYTGFSLARPSSNGTAFGGVGIFLRSSLANTEEKPNYVLDNSWYNYFYNSGYGGNVIANGTQGRLLFGFCI